MHNPPPAPHTHTHHVLEKATNHNPLRCTAQQNPYETPNEITKQIFQVKKV